MSKLREFLQTDDGKRWKRDIIFRNDTTMDAIINTRISFFQRPPRGDELQPIGECLAPLRDTVSDADFSGEVFFYYEFAFIAESNLIIYMETMSNLFFAAMAALVMCLILIPSIKLSMIVMSTVLMILVAVVGYLSFLGFRIDVVTGVILILTIGFAVDNSAHICHAYQHSHRKTRKEKVIDALNHTGVPIVFGDLTTFLALVSCAFTTSVPAQTFFYCLFLVMLFGIISATLFLPVVLVHVGPLDTHHGVDHLPDIELSEFDEQGPAGAGPAEDEGVSISSQQTIHIPV